jgi:hypothetical protein
MSDRWQIIKNIWNDEHPWLWFTPGLSIGLLIGFLIGVSTATEIKGWFFDSFWPEALGILFTVTVIEKFAQRREEKNLRERLIHEASSRSNERAKSAVDDLRWKKWLIGDRGLLQGVEFQSADLKNVRFFEANLSDTKFRRVDLSGALLINTDLGRTSMFKVDLSGADLKNANLIDAKFDNVEFDKETTLPDETKWIPGTDMRRFTDPEHPNYWQPEVGKGSFYQDR